MGKLKVEESISVEEGKHEAEITGIEFRTVQESYEYMDIIVQLEEEDVKLSLSVPAKVTKQSTLGKILNRFTEKDLDDMVGEEIDPEEILIGKKVQMMTVNEENDQGQEFAQIVAKSFKPVE